MRFRLWLARRILGKRYIVTFGVPEPSGLVTAAVSSNTTWILPVTGTNT